MTSDTTLPEVFQGVTDGLDVSVTRNPLGLVMQTQGAPGAPPVRGPWTQCEIAQQCLNDGRDCCRSPASCDEEGDLEAALAVARCAGAHTSYDAPPPPGQSPFSMEQIKEQIDLGLPVGVRIEWFGGGAHVVAILGYDEASNTIHVSDPVGSSGPQSLALFPAYYRSGGRWTDTYCTRSGSADGAQ